MVLCMRSWPEVPSGSMSMMIGSKEKATPQRNMKKPPREATKTYHEVIVVTAAPCRWSLLPSFSLNEMSHTGQTVKRDELVGDLEAPFAPFLLPMTSDWVVIKCEEPTKATVNSVEGKERGSLHG